MERPWSGDGGAARAGGEDIWPHSSFRRREENEAVTCVEEDEEE